MNKKQTRIDLLEAHIRRLQKRIAQLEPRSNRYSWYRVGIFFGGVGLSLLLWYLIGWWLALPVFVIAMLIFSIIAHYQQQIDRSLNRHTLLMHIKSAYIARMRLDWEHIPPLPTRPQAEESTENVDHPFEYDIDISGKRSLHQLINTAVSREGSERLRNWLLTTQPEMVNIQRRQALVRELTPMTRFRDRLTLNSLLSRSNGNGAENVQGERLLHWLNKHQPQHNLRLLLWGTALLNLLTLVLLILNFLIQMPALWLFTLGISIILFFATADQRGEIAEDATNLRYGMTTLSRIFSFLETYPYGRHEQLKTLCQPFLQTGHDSPTSLLSHTARIESASTLRRNPFLWLPLNAFLPWDLYCAYQLNIYKERIATRLPIWLETWFELEALCSLATFAYLNPDYTMPAVTPDLAMTNQAQNGQKPDTALFQADHVGHPLIKDEKKVTNSFAIKQLGEVFILTGSNMAGKSTFLRTLGVNLALAYAGGPVNASHFQTTLFRLFTCIRVTDSVTDGYSYFYAEVRRLRALLNALNQPDQLPLFFLVDEIFKGTNNRERLIGSRSFVRALAGRRCVGIISTHDLELVRLEETVPHATNLHFREEVKDGQLVFDYILRSGPCPTTNALKIMAMEGLPIDG